MFSFDEVQSFDAEVASAMEQELGRQRSHIELIASENFVSKAVMAAMGSPLTNKYAEGYPAKRYYGGCEYVDIVENLAIERAKKLFGCDYANVQPHSGAQANMAVFFAIVNPGDTVMGMNLNHGGHLTHGSPVNLSGLYYNFVAYGVDFETHRIDYDALEKQAKECKPKMIVAGASAYPRTIDFARLREICDEIGRNGFKKILLFSSHGGNNAFIANFLRAVRAEKKEYDVFSMSAAMSVVVNSVDTVVKL